MNIDHVHFYVEDARAWSNWFVQVLGFQKTGSQSSSHTHTESVQSKSISFRLSSPLTPNSPVAHYLRSHPAGVADVAFQVSDLDAILDQATNNGITILQPVQIDRSTGEPLRTAQVQGWGDLKHTLIETIDFPSSFSAQAFTAETLRRKVSPLSAPRPLPFVDRPLISPLTAIDHIVLNVGGGELEPTIAYYETLFGFQRQQSFSIRTDRSALCSQVLTHPDGAVQFPINEPASSSSQIQEFLDLNRGAGIQHIALQTDDAIATIAQIRQRGLSFLTVPSTYYDQLQQRSGFLFSSEEWQGIQTQEILVDWKDENSEAALLQAFTQPIFDQPTFFFELIERRTYWRNQCYQQAQGFGEGNFQALFEAIEREQLKRGSLG
jgi:4-hydroxyphenylpyruvate dioxygenase